MVKTTFLVPINDNEGKDFHASDWRKLESMLIEAFGGFSRTRGVHGEWKYQGKVYRDISRQYSVSLESWHHLPAWLDIIKWAREHFRQEALYVEVAGVPEIMGAEVAATKEEEKTK